MRTGLFVAVGLGVALVGACTQVTNEPGTAAEYPQLRPWVLEQEPGPEDTTVQVGAVSGFCIDIDGEELGLESLERVEVEERGDEVVIATWVGEPATPRPTECAGVGVDLPAEVRLEEPLGSRRLVDAACRLERFETFVACEEHPGA